MNRSWLDVYAARQRFEELTLEAETHRMWTAQQAQKPTLVARSLYALGARLELWGCRLQSRYRRVVHKPSANAYFLGETASIKNC